LDYFQYQPHSIIDRPFWEAAKLDDRFTGLREAVQAVVETAPARPPIPLASDFMAAHWHNDRARVDEHWQKNRRLLSYLIVNRCLKGIEKDDRDERLLDWLWSFTTEPIWTVSAHVPGRSIPDLSRGMLDLASTEMAALLAETVEVLQPWMDTISPQLAPSILHEIERKILIPFVGNFQQFGWANLDNPHVNNWTGVCAGSILAACRAMTNLGRPHPEAEKMAIELLRVFWQRGFTADGECDEGIGYWIYGVAFACYGMSRLSEAEFRANFDVARVAQVASYPRRAHLTGIAFFNGNDSNMIAGQPVYLTPWLAAATGEDWLLQWPTAPDLKGKELTAPEWKRPVDSGQQHFRHVGQILRLLARPRLERIKPAETSADAPPALLTDQQTGIVRTATPAGPMIVCLSGGSNAERHNHNDVGHFLVFLNGTQRVVDLGAPHYVSDFFSAKRYTYMPARSRGHNVPVINGQEQYAGGETYGKILKWKPETGSTLLSLELAAAYPAEAKLKSWVRTLRQRGDAKLPFALEDQYLTAEPGVSIAHAWWTVDRPEFLAADRVRMGQLVFHLTRPLSVQSEEFTAEAMNLREFVGQTLYRVEAGYETDGDGKLSVQTLIAVE
jgi:hypothetical protein